MSAEAPRDALDLRTARDGSRRAIPWDGPIDPALDSERRTVLGRAWLHLARQEHLAVGAFALIARELAAVGCDSVVLALVARASSDEVRHADLCRRMASRLLGAGEVPVVFRGVPKPRADGQRSLRDRALLHVIEMCCLNETFTGVYLTESLARATDPVMRAAIESLLEDEIDHGRVGWAHLAAAVRDGWGASVAARALPTVVDRAVGSIFDRARRAGGHADAVLVAHGHFAGNDALDVYARTLHDVIIPGFEAVNLDPKPLRALAQRRGWTAATRA
jgi:hypothetical protein